MKVITICNPYPELILNLEKPIENRPQRWNYRGELLIHAGKSRSWMSDDDWRRYPNLAWGAIVGRCDLVECLELPYDDCLDRPLQRWPEKYRHLQDHEHANGPFCLILENVKRFAKPIPCRGALGIWRVPTELQAAVGKQLTCADQEGR